ncbi:MAG: DUF4974 domain-containing protein [Saprospiraceae bacterium]|nr:DUF4974 domain-containing protein [Saprospiraceae bacterium]
MNEISSEYTELAIKYLSGDATDAETEALEAWVNADPNNRAHFIQLKNAWIWSGLKQKPSDIDASAAWKNIQKIAGILAAPSTAKVRPLATRWISLAAAVACLLALSIWLFLGGGTGPIEVVAENSPVEQVLPDGSTVTLNQSAELRYALDEASRRRKAILKGDAFFEILRDTVHPFVIQAADVEVAVLGTSFYIDARADQDNISVIVESGQVSVKNGNQQVLLSTGEMSIYRKSSNQLIKLENTDQNYKGWITKTIQFEKTPLAEVVKALERNHHANIVIGDSALRNCELTATFRDKSLEATIRIVESTLGIVAEYGEGQIVLRGEGCE